MEEPFTRKKNRRTERLVVLLTPAEERLLQTYFIQHSSQHNCSTVSELIRDFIRRGIEVTIDTKT